MPAPKTIYQLKVTLNVIGSSIWRRILVPENVTLYQLHTILQIAMGWTDSHLHQFMIAGQNYGDPQNDEYGELHLRDENRYQLKQLALPEKSKFSYEYDFGDSWEHTIQVEKILPAEKGIYYPLCLTGKRACPPEDVGGVPGYGHFLQALADPDHEEHAEYLQWIGGHFDPQNFDLDAVNEHLRYYKRGVFTDPEIMSRPTADARAMQKMLVWAQSLPVEQFERFAVLPVRRDMLTFLKYLLENRELGSRSTGNLPLKAVRAICEKFVNPPELDERIGDHIYKLRTEADVWPLYYLHILAEDGGLLTGGSAKVWQVTPAGHRYLELPAPIQIAFLLSTWWFNVDWRAAFPFEGFSRGFPHDLNSAALSCLLELPVDETFSPEIFADRLIAKSGLIWPIEDQGQARDILHDAIERMVIEPLNGFGVLDCEYGLKKIGLSDYRDLTSLRLTSPGKGLLQTL